MTAQRQKEHSVPTRHTAEAERETAHTHEQEEHAHAEPAKHVDAPHHEALASVHEQLARLEVRLTALEQHAHSEHAIGKEAADQIAEHAVNKINQHLQAAFGHSGTPSA